MLIVDKARYVLSYESPNHAGEMRQYRDVQSISMALPLTVNVQDFFRPEWSVHAQLTTIHTADLGSLVSHFTIASDGREYLRIGAVDLKANDAETYRVEACSQAQDQPLVREILSLMIIILTLADRGAESTAVMPFQASAVWRQIRWYIRGLVASHYYPDNLHQLVERCCA